MARESSGHRSNSLFRFTYLIVIAVVIYLIAQFILFTSRDTTNYIVAKQGEIVETFSAKGVIVRDEQLVRATSTGIVQYYYPAGKELQKGTLVATLLNDYYGDILQERINEIYAQIGDIDNDEYEEAFQTLDDNLTSSIAQYLRSKSVNDYRALYNLQTVVQDAVSSRKDMYSLMSNTRIGLLLSEQGIYENEQNAVIKNLYMSTGGIIDYSYDGYEGWTVQQIGSDFLANYRSNYSYFEQNLQSVDVGTPIYRLVSSPVWRIVIFIDGEAAAYFEDVDTVDFIYNTSEKLSGSIESIEKISRNEYKLVMKVITKMQDFMTDRTANLVFTKNSHSGIKISESCLVEREYYTVPRGYVTSSGDQDGLLVVNGESVSFVPIRVATVRDNKVYFELPSGLNVGQLVQKPEGTETVPVGAAETVYGVYVVNGGYEEFKIIKVTYQAQGYAIVEGINLYDRVKVNSGK